MWLGAQVGEHVAEGVAARVALGVVAHDRLDRAAALLAHPGGGAAQRGRDVLGVLGGVQLAVGQPGVVVDHADDHGLSARRGSCAFGALAGSPVPGAARTWAAEGVDVQQRAGLGPLIAAGGLARLAAAPARDAVTAQDLPAGRAVPTGERRQRIGPQLVLARASKMACSASADSAHGQRAAPAAAAHTTRRWPAHPGSRPRAGGPCRWLAARRRSAGKGNRPQTRWSTRTACPRHE